MSDFSWLDSLAANAWTPGPRAGLCLDMTLREFAARSGIEAPGQAVAEFRKWTFAGGAHRYAIAWTHTTDPDESLIVVRKSDTGSAAGSKRQ